MLLGIRNDQRELSREIAQVVHHEGRQPVIGLELAILGETTIGLVLREVDRHVTTHHLQQVTVLEVRLEWRWRTRETTKPINESICVKGTIRRSPAVPRSGVLRMASGNERFP